MVDGALHESQIEHWSHLAFATRKQSLRLLAHALLPNLPVNTLNDNVGQAERNVVNVKLSSQQR